MILHRIEATLDVEQLKVQKMVFGQDDGWKNMCTTKLILDKNKKSIYQYGLSTLIFQNHLIGHIAQQYGEHFADFG